MESRMSDRTAATHTLSQCLTVSSKYLCVSTLHTSKVPKSSFKAFSEITDAKVIIPESYQSKTRNKLISTLLYDTLNEASLTTSRDKKKQDVSVRVKSSWNNDNERQSNTTPSENVLGLRSNTIQTRVGFTSKPITIRIRGDERPNSTPKKAVLRSRANTRRTGDTVREKTNIQGEEIVKRAEDIRAIADAVILKIAPTGHSATPLTTPAEQGARPLPIPISEDGIRRNVPSTKKSHTSPTGDGSSIRPNAGDGDQRTLNAPPSEARHRPNTTPVGERPRRTTTCQDVVDGVRMRPTTTPSRLRQRHTTTPFEYGAKMRPATTPSGVTNIQRQRYLINEIRSATIPAAQPYCWATNRKDGSQRCQESTWSTQRNHIPAAFNWSSRSRDMMPSSSSVLTLLYKYLQDDKLLEFVTLLRTSDTDTRQLAVNLKPDSTGNTLFFTACQMSKLPFVVHMLSECSPDLEMPGLCTKDDHISLHYATPLWLAAFSGNSPLAQLLICHRAEVNAISSSGSTPIMAACSGGQLGVVFLLVANGADIHRKTSLGITCLMMSTQHPEIAQLLIRCGARVNDADCLGNTALHYAAEVGCINTVKVLIEMGANPLIQNLDKCNVILTAAKARNEHIVEYLLAVRSPKTSDIITAYLVLGAMTIVLEDNYAEGVRHWQKAIALHKLTPTYVHTFKLKKSTLAECFNKNDLEIPQEGLVHITEDSNKLNLQALIICERHYGPKNQNFINLLMYRGAVCADKDQFTQALRFWKLAYTLQLEKLMNWKHIDSKHLYMFELFHASVLKTVEYIVQTLFHHWKFQDIYNVKVDHPLVPETLTRDLVQQVVCHIEKILSNHSESVSHVTFLARSCLCMLFIYLHMYPASIRSTQIGLHLRRLIRLNPRGDLSETLLHMCLDIHLLDSMDINHHMKRHWPSCEMVDILLLLGANPHARDLDGNTVLHKAVLLHSKEHGLTSELITTLLKRGVHLDQVNHKGQTALDLLSPGDGLRQVDTMFSLQCLAARTVATYKLSYIGEVPRDLYSFIELHAS